MYNKFSCYVLKSSCYVIHMHASTQVVEYEYNTSCVSFYVFNKVTNIPRRALYTQPYYVEPHIVGLVL